MLRSSKNNEGVAMRNNHRLGVFYGAGLCLIALFSISCSGANGGFVTFEDAGPAVDAKISRKDGPRADSAPPADSKTPLPDAKPNPFDPDNDKKDSDCDGLSDAEEFSTRYPGNKQTDPANPDSDGDGILDGVEVGKQASVDARCQSFQGDADPSTKTSPVDKDSDADGRDDGHEDANRNGKLDSGEIDPLNADSDGDRLLDGLEGEIKNGSVDSTQTDPRKADTDGDGIGDGVETNITKTDPTKADSDNDGCTDGQEDQDQDGIVDAGETDPNNGSDCGPANFKDQDNDGIPDGIEDKNKNGVYDPANGETDWQNADTDGDGIKDGVEDSNQDGRVGIGETDPRAKDSDCDGLIDGPDAGGYLGEDQNANGVVDAGETNPIVKDSDGDGLSDGLERGVTQNPDAERCKYFSADQDPTSTTDPTKKDSDGDGIADGSEDNNQNGRVDKGELDPNDGQDGVGPAASVCKASNLTPVTFHQEGQADITLALPTTFKELTPIKKDGKNVGVIGFDTSSKIAFVLYREAGSGSASSQELQLRVDLAAVGALKNEITQSFTSWDGYPAVVAYYSQAGSDDVKQRANAIARRLVAGSSGALSGAGSATGPFALQVQVVRRSASSSVVLVALIPESRYREPGIFDIGDLAGGSALAQFGDRNAVQCEPFRAGGGKVDILFVVDNSVSMLKHLQALADTANAMAKQLDNSSLDWRVAMVATDYSHPQGHQLDVFRGFTRNTSTFQAWLVTWPRCLDLSILGRWCLAWEDFPHNILNGNKTVPCSNNNDCGVLREQGASQEVALQSAAKAVDFITPPQAGSPQKKLRQGAALVIIILSDADDQSGAAGSIVDFSRFFSTPQSLIGSYKNKLPAGQTITVNGILCNSADTCGETQNTPRRTEAIVRATGGLQGDIETGSSIADTMRRIVQNSIAQQGYQLLKAPIGTSVKVALAQVRDASSCNKNNIKRSRQNGFDFDGVNGTLSFYGTCRPPDGQVVDAAVSYRYWIDTTTNPDGNTLPCESDPYFDPSELDYCKGRRVCDQKSDVCNCPADCGGIAPPGMTCNSTLATCDFVCTPDCGGSCGPHETCDLQSCSCQCNPSSTCPGGFTFDQASCSCRCDVGALACSATEEVDNKTCSCQCKPACGGCPSGSKCNPITCECKTIG
jgi:hypothetical protein